MGLLTDEEISKRIESPLNLMNRLRLSTDNKNVRHPSLPPSINDILPEVDKKLDEQVNGLKGQAAKVLKAALDELEFRLPEIHKPEKLASIAKEMSAVIDYQNKKSASDNTNNTQVIIYAPQIRDERTYSSVTAKE